MFIQVIQGMCTDEAMLRQQMDRWREELAPGAQGWLGGTYGMTDDGQFVAVVRFESREAAARNSLRPEQGEWWAAASRCFDGEVSFHDCARFREFMSQPMDMLHEARPEIIGGTIAIDADGWFTETMAFRSEAEARRGEQVEMPDEMAQQFNREMEQVHDMRFLDLHHPWFA